MNDQTDKTEEKEQKSAQETLADLGADPDNGLSTGEAKARLEEYGPNSIEEGKQNPFLKFLSYFWGPIPYLVIVGGCGHSHERSVVHAAPGFHRRLR